MKYDEAIQRAIGALESRIALINRDIGDVPEGIASIMRIGAENDQRAVDILREAEVRGKRIEEIVRRQTLGS